MKIIVVIGVVWSALCLLLKPASCGNLISEPPHDLTLPLSSDAIFTCRANTSYNITRISWIIGARGIDLEYYSYKDTLNGYGISVTHSSMNLSILSVSGVKDNNGTTVKCTVSANDGPTIGQSPMAVLTLYGPPGPIVNFNVQDVGPMSLRLSWEPLTFPLPQIPFNYTLNISGPNDTNEIIELPQSASNYTYRADQDGDCQLYTFTLKAMNSAGYSEPETLIRGIADAPGNLSSNISHKVFFNDSLIRVNISVLSPNVCQYYPITSYLLEYHDITNSTQSIYSTSHEIISTDNSSNHFISHDNHVTLFVNGTQLDLNRRYTIYITAANDIGATDTQEIEIITSHLQDFSAVLVGDILTVTCQFGVGTPMDVECTVMIYIGDVLVDNVTIDKNTSANDVVSHDFKSSLFNTSSLLIIAYDHEESPLKFTTIISPPTPTPTLGPPSTGTISATYSTSSSVSLPVPSRTPHYNGTSEPPISQTTISAISGGVALILLIAFISFLLIVTASRICIKKKKNTIVQPTEHDREEAHSYGEVNRNEETCNSKSETVITISSHDADSFENIKNSLGLSQNNLVEPYGITQLVKPEPGATQHKEPLYQEVNEARRVKPHFSSQSSTAPLLESQVSTTSDPPPPLTPREPFYHMLDGTIEPHQVIPIYDEVPSKSKSDSVDGSRTTTPSMSTPIGDRIYHTLDPTPPPDHLPMMTSASSVVLPSSAGSSRVCSCDDHSSPSLTPEDVFLEETRPPPLQLTSAVSSSGTFRRLWSHETNVVVPMGSGYRSTGSRLNGVTQNEWYKDSTLERSVGSNKCSTLPHSLRSGLAGRNRICSEPENKNIQMTLV